MQLIFPRFGYETGGGSNLHGAGDAQLALAAQNLRQRYGVHRQNPVLFEIVDLFAPPEDPLRHVATHGLGSWRSTARARLAPRSGAGESRPSSTARHVPVPPSTPAHRC